MKRKKKETPDPPAPAPKIRRTDAPWWDLGTPWLVESYGRKEAR